MNKKVQELVHIAFSNLDKLLHFVMLPLLILAPAKIVSPTDWSHLALQFQLSFELVSTFFSAVCGIL